MAGSLDYRITVDSTGATSGLTSFAGAAKRELGAVDTALGDTVTAADKVAVAIDQMAAKLDTELTAAKQAADALSTALGPELGGRMDVTSVLNDLRRMGLTFDEIRANADTLATSLKGLDDIQLSHVDAGMGNIDTQFGKLRDSADQTRSVVANFAGNLTQELPGIAGAFGPLNMAASQFVEYAAEGNIALRSLAPAAAGIGVAALAMYGLQRGAQQAAERTKEVEEGIKDLSTASDELFAKNAGELWVDMWSRALFDGKKIEDQLKSLAETNLVGARRWLDNAEAIGLNAESQAMLATAIAEVEAETATAERVQAKYGTTVADVTVEVGAAEGALIGVAKATGDAARAAENLDAKWAALKGELDADQAFLNIQSNFDDVKAKAEEAWKAAADGAVDAEQKNRDYQSAVISLKQDVIDYGATVLGLPPQRVTEILADIDNGSLESAERALDELTRMRTAIIQVVTQGIGIGVAGRLAALPPAGKSAAPAMLGAAPAAAPAAAATPVFTATVPASVTNVTNNVTVPRGATGREIDAAVARWQRINGRR